MRLFDESKTLANVQRVVSILIADISTAFDLFGELDVGHQNMTENKCSMSVIFPFPHGFQQWPAEEII